MDFSCAYYTQLMNSPGKCTLGQKQQTRIMEASTGKISQAMALVETHVRAEFDMPLVGPIDWSPGCTYTTRKTAKATTINWSAIIAFVEELWAALAPIITPFLTPVTP